MMLKRNGSVRKAGGSRSFMAVCAAVIAVLAFSGCADRGPDKYELRKEAVALFNAGDYEGALNKLNEALDASRGQVSELQYDILRYKAECQLRTGDISAARDSYNALIILDKNDSNLAQYEELLAELNALDEIERSAELFEAGSYADAAEAYRQYAALNGTISGKTAWYNLAVCEEYSGNYEEAAELWQQYTDMYPDDLSAAKEERFVKSRMEDTVQGEP